MLKNFNGFDKKLFSFAVAMLLVFGYLIYDDSAIIGLAVPHGPLIATIAQTKNDVRLKYSSDFRWVTMRKKSTVHLGDSVFTGPGSNAVLTLPDNTTLEIQENSMITFSMVGSQLVLNLKSGHIQSDSAKIQVVNSEPEKAREEVEALAKPKAPLAPLKKVSRVKKIDRGIAQIAPPPQVANVKPVVLSPKANEVHPVKVDIEGKQLEPSSLSITWQHPNTDGEFEVQVATDDKFANLEYNDKVKSTQVTVLSLKMGPHFLRVREKSADDSKPFEWSDTVPVQLQAQQPSVNTQARSPALLA